MSQTQVLDASLPAAVPDAARAGLQGVLGEPAWQRLPAAVRERFGEPPRTLDYGGSCDIVAASLAGRAPAWLCRLLGTPVVPRTGVNVPAIVRVGPAAAGVRWTREHRWPDAHTSRVRSTQVIGAGGTLVKKLPAGLCIQLCVQEKDGALHWLSRRCCFQLSLPWQGRHPRLRLVLPRWLSPGTVHGVHRDESAGWFRSPMTVTHSVLRRLFHPTGRFRALGD
jgi:hypothetical protein